MEKIIGIVGIVGVPPVAIIRQINKEQGEIIDLD